MDRRKKILREAKKIGCDAVIVTEPENLFYATGFWGEAVGILGAGHNMILAPALEAGRARSESDCDVVQVERGADAAIPEMVKGKTACTDCSDYRRVLFLEKRIPRLRPDPSPILNSRLVKDDAELGVLRAASRIIDEMFALCEQRMGAGQKESELQAILMGYAAGRGMFDTGYRWTLNPLIVAGGANGALPHAQVTGKRFRRGELVTVDITLRYKGYVSDATRTFAVGRIRDEARRVYDTVKESQRAGIRATRAGARCSAVDEACRHIIREAGFDQYFIHATGHGIGLDVHEQPAISPKSGTILRKNMAITVEPGIYIPNRFGVRIEDSLAVGGRPMHRFTKELVAV